MAFQFVHESLVREYNFPSKCYPRFRYFQKHYEGLLPELKKVEEYASYYKIDSRKYKSLSDQNYDSIGVTVIYNKNTANKPLASKLVKVQVSAKVDIEKKVAAKKDDDDKQVSAHLDEEKQVSAKLDVEKQASAKLDDEKLVAAKFDDGKQDSVQLDDDEQKFPMKFKVWNTQQRGRIDNKVLNITVFMINEKKDLALHKWFICYNMSEERMKNVVLHDVESNVSSTYEDMVKNNFKFKYDEDNKTSTLSSTIQYLLEYNVVSVLNEIKKFICHIEEHFHDEENKLTQSSAMKNHPSEEDVSKMPKTYVDSANNRSLERVGKKHGKYVDNQKNRKLGRVGLEYGMAPDPKQGPSSADQKEYSGEWEHKLQAKGEEFSEVQSPDTLAGDMSQLKIDSQSQFQDEKQSSAMKKQPSEEDVQELKITMKTMKFEIFGLLKQTRIDNIRKSVPTCPEISIDLRRDIFKIAGIIGCGTEYGQLVMHVSRTEYPEGPPESIRSEVKQLLQKHTFSYGYSIDLIDELTEFSFKQGDTIESKLLGTLGCFVIVKHGDTNQLLCITCAHLVTERGACVKIKSNTNPEHIMNGTCLSHMYELRNVDIAAIKIEYNADCVKSLINENNEICRNWTFETGDPFIGLKVYKRGYKTGFTQGNIYLKYLFPNSVITSSLILRSKNGRFSVEGDSGSAVWYEILGDGEETQFKVIGLISGGSKEGSYCCAIQNNIQALERDQNWKVKEAREDIMHAVQEVQEVQVLEVQEFQVQEV